MSAPNVSGAYRAPSETFGLFGPPRKSTYRAAVADCIRKLKARHSLTNVVLAEHLGCDDGTIANAENEATSLDPVTLLRIAFVFGEAAIDPVRALYSGGVVPKQSVETLLDEALHALSEVKKLRARERA